MRTPLMGLFGTPEGCFICDVHLGAPKKVPHPLSGSWELGAGIMRCFHDVSDRLDMLATATC